MTTRELACSQKEKCTHCKASKTKLSNCVFQTQFKNVKMLIEKAEKLKIYRD